MAVNWVCVEGNFFLLECLNLGNLYPSLADMTNPNLMLQQSTLS